MNVLDIRVQKLFAITLGLKVAASALGWHLQSPWLLGFVVPLAFMAAYIALGLNRRDTDVSDEKFADSCYYLGFIFTITSIIFSLFDLPSIGTRIQDIAVRFGAAMVSTVLGLGVRVYLVSFRTDVADAMRDAEDALLGTTRAFTERLTMSLERLQDFESRVDSAARSSVERVNLQVEALSKNHAEKLTEFFADLTMRNQEAFTTTITEVKNASVRLAHSVDRYSVGMKGNLTSIESKVSQFADAVTTRLQNTTFPDDYFAKHLAGPLSQLETAAGDIAQQVASASVEMAATTKALGSSLQQVQKKSGQAETAMDSVLRLAGHQHLVLETAQGQLGALGQLTERLSTFDALLNNVAAELAANNNANAELAQVVGKLASEAVDGRQALERSLASVSSVLSEQAAASTSLTSRMDSTVTASERLVVQLGESAAAQSNASSTFERTANLASHAASKYATSVESEQAGVRALTVMGDRADRTLVIIAEAVQGLHEVVRNVSELTSAMRSLGTPPSLRHGVHVRSAPG